MRFWNWILVLFQQTPSPISSRDPTTTCISYLQKFNILQIQSCKHFDPLEVCFDNLLVSFSLIHLCWIFVQYNNPDLCVLIITALMSRGKKTVNSGWVSQTGGRMVGWSQPSGQIPNCSCSFFKGWHISKGCIFCTKPYHCIGVLQHWFLGQNVWSQQVTLGHRQSQRLNMVSIGHTRSHAVTEA